MAQPKDPLDLDRGLGPLATTVVRRNVGVLAVALMLILAAPIFAALARSIAPSLAAMGVGPEAVGVFGGLGESTLLIFGWVLASLSTLQLLLSERSRPGWAGLRDVGTPRSATFLGLSVIVEIATSLAVAALLFVFAMINGTTGEPSALDVIIFSAIAFFIVALPLSLALPEVVVSGGVRSGFVAKWAWRKHSRMRDLAVVSAVPLLILGDFLYYFARVGDAAQRIVGASAQTSPAPLLPLISYAWVVVAAALFTSLILAKVYREAVIAESQDEAGRVADVFE